MDIFESHPHFDPQNVDEQVMAQLRKAARNNLPQTLNGPNNTSVHIVTGLGAAVDCELLLFTEGCTAGHLISTLVIADRWRDDIAAGIEPKLGVYGAAQPRTLRQGRPTYYLATVELYQTPSQMVQQIPFLLTMERTFGKLGRRGAQLLISDKPFDESQLGVSKPQIQTIKVDSHASYVY